MNYYQAYYTHQGFPCGSDGKESAYNCRRPGFDPWSGRSLGERNGNPFQHSCLENSKDRGTWRFAVHGITKNWRQLSNFPGCSAGKESTCNVGNLGLIPGSKGSPGEGNGYPLQYSGLKIPWIATASCLQEYS